MCFETLAWHVVDRLEVTNHRGYPGRRQIPVVPESSTTCEECIVQSELLHGHAFGEIAGLVHICAFENSGVIGE